MERCVVRFLSFGRNFKLCLFKIEEVSLEFFQCPPKLGGTSKNWEVPKQMAQPLQILIQHGG